jgi:hypothetical protein
MVAVPDNTAAVDAAVFCVMVTALVAVHPLLLVTVTVYVPGEVTDNAANELTTVLPSLHEYVPPPVAVKLIVVVVQVNTVVEVLLVMPAVGSWLNVITTSSVDAVHGLFDIVHLNV